jgi:hypothetical protein
MPSSPTMVWQAWRSGSLSQRSQVRRYTVAREHRVAQHQRAKAPGLRLSAADQVPVVDVARPRPLTARERVPRATRQH